MGTASMKASPAAEPFTKGAEDIPGIGREVLPETEEDAVCRHPQLRSRARRGTEAEEVRRKEEEHVEEEEEPQNGTKFSGKLTKSSRQPKATLKAPSLASSWGPR